jgi:hypothetical protein
MQRLEEIFRSTSESTEYKVCPSKYGRNGKKNTVNYTEHLNSMLNWGNINRIIFTANHTEDLNSMLNLRNIKYR